MSVYAPYERPLTAYTPRDRVELHPGTDQWMMGDQYGEVASIGRKYVTVLMDRSGRTLKVTPDRLRLVSSPLWPTARGDEVTSGVQSCPCCGDSVMVEDWRVAELCEECKQADCAEDGSGPCEREDDTTD